MIAPEPSATGGDRPSGPPVGGKPWGRAIHATAVAIGGAGLLIVGPSGAGKSRLAAGLIGLSSPRRPIRLIGDDRILLTRRGRDILARPHPRIAGFLERRGFGIIACPSVSDVVMRGVVRIEASLPTDASDEHEAGRTTSSDAAAENFSALPAVIVDTSLSVDVQKDIVLRWWRDACTTPAAKAAASPSRSPKD